MDKANKALLMELNILELGFLMTSTNGYHMEEVLQ